jgi:molybdopterin-binding protein
VRYRSLPPKTAYCNLAAFPETERFEPDLTCMALSARNQLRGKIETIQNGEILSHVVVRVGDNLIESVITRTSADEMKLKVGDTVRAVIKSTEVMIAKD